MPTVGKGHTGFRCGISAGGSAHHMASQKSLLRSCLFFLKSHRPIALWPHPYISLVNLTYFPKVLPPNTIVKLIFHLPNVLQQELNFI